MPYSLQQAADASGVNRSTVLRAIKAGKISAMKDEHGAWCIEPCELHRVYPAKAEAHEARPEATHQDALAVAVAELRSALADMKQQRDTWQTLAEKALAEGREIQKALTDQRARQEREPMSWWHWLRSTG